MSLLKTILVFGLLTAITCCKRQTQTGRGGKLFCYDGKTFTDVSAVLQNTKGKL